jgi:hypothetical protein
VVRKKKFHHSSDCASPILRPGQNLTWRCSWPCYARCATDRGLHGTTASQRLFGERDTQVSPPRSRFGLCRRGHHDRRHERSDSSNGTAVAMAERSRRARHRLVPTRVPRSRDRDERGGTAPRPSRVRRVLHAFTNPSRPRQGHAGHASSLTGVGRARCRHNRSRRSTPSLRSPHSCRTTSPYYIQVPITCALSTSALR